MHLDLRCPACSETMPVSYGDLYTIWKAGYDKMDDEIKEEMFLTAQIMCTCGHVEKWDSPMFSYLFDVVFHEILSLDD